MQRIQKGNIIRIYKILRININSMKVNFELNSMFLLL